MPINVAKLRDEYESLHHKVTTSDGLTLFLREWRPAPGSEKETAILILHGITAYSGPYAMIGEPAAIVLAEMSSFVTSVKLYPLLERSTRNLCS
ncbi:MAG: hypothetical protein ACW99J_11570 [Candidatus Thorarchaeota archaeon]